jgi:hypothetical protein
LLGHGEEYLASISLGSTVGTPLQPAARPSSSGQPSGAVEASQSQVDWSGYQDGQKMKEMVGAVESVLRELGEDPQR